jgi:hypothetical protein
LIEWAEEGIEAGSLRESGGREGKNLNQNDARILIDKTRYLQNLTVERATSDE